MKKTCGLIFCVFISSLSNISFAGNVTSDILYDKAGQKITSSDSKAFIKFEERDEGNTSYFFDYFAGNPAIVHDNDSLDSYSLYSVVEKKQNGFEINCAYVDLKSGSNGVVSKDGRCGLTMKFPNGSSLTGEEGDIVVNDIVNENNKINTSYFTGDKTKYLPIMMFQNNERYVYKLYKNKDDLSNGVFNIVSCENDGSGCVSYDESTWVVVTNKPNPEVNFKILKKSDDGSTFKNSVPMDSDEANSSMPPFEISSTKAFMLPSTGKKLKSYLLKGDKITLLAMGDDNICAVRFINNKNKAIDGNVSCEDLGAFK